jgi:hypothetical protein
MKRNFRWLLVVLAAACSTPAKDIAPSYASPALYNGYTCAQIASESARIDARAARLASRLDAAALNDKGIALVGTLFFPPALLALGGTKAEEEEYARLKAERAALAQTADVKACATGLAAARPPAVY